MVWQARIPLLRRGWLRLWLAAFPSVAIAAASGQAAAQGAGLEQQWKDYHRALAVFDAGRAAEARGDRAEARTLYSEADQLLRGILLQNPGRADVYGPLGEVLVRRGRAAEAMVLLGRQVHEGNKDARIRWPLALALRAMKQHRRALSEAKEVLAQDPDHGEALALLAATAVELGEDAEALPALRRLVLAPAEERRGSSSRGAGHDEREAPRPQQWRLWLAQVLSRSGGRAGAAEALPLLEALAQEQLPQELVPQVRRALALAQCRSEDPVLRRRGLEALPALAAAAAGARPADPRELRELDEVGLALATALLREHRPNEAIAPLRRLVARAPQDPRPALLLARALLASGDPGRAEAAQILARLGDGAGWQDQDLLGELGRVLLLAGSARAAATLKRATAAAPQDVALCVDLGTALVRLGPGQAQAAQEEARRCRALAPDDPETIGLQAGLAVAAGRLGEGILSYRQALRRAPADPALRAGLGQALYQRGLATLTSGPAGAVTAATGRGALVDLREAHELLDTLLTARALAVAQLAVGGAAEAAATLRPQAERGKDQALLLLYARALRESGKPDAAAAVLAQVRLAPGSAHRALLRQEQVLTLLMQQRPAEACQSFDNRGAGVLASDSRGADHASRDDHPDGAGAEALERLWALSCLAAGRAFVSLGVNAHGTADGRALASLGAVAHGADGKAVAVVLSPAGAATALGTALRLRARLQEAEWAEAEILQAALQVRAGQAEQALKRLQALETAVSPATLRQLLSPGGFDELLMQVALRAGQLPVAAQRAAGAVAAMPAAQGPRVRRALAAGYVSRALVAYERSDFDRAYMLLKVPPVQAELSTRPGVIAYDLGAVQLARGRRDEALALWSRLDAKELPEKWLALGTYHDALGDRRNALENYRRYLQSVPPTARHAEQVRRWVEAIQRFYSGAAAAGSAEAPGPRDGHPEGAAPRTMARRSNETRREASR